MCRPAWWGRDRIEIDIGRKWWGKGLIAVGVTVLIWVCVVLFFCLSK
jgi:hypothetical protein